jgi:hypothetical protein
MNTALVYPNIDLKRDERQGRNIALIITGVFITALLLLLILIQFVIPIPPIPPDPDPITLEIGLLDGTGGDAETQGGGSQGNSGDPGMQQPNDQASNTVKNPADNGSVTSDDPDNPTAPNSNHNGNQPTVSSDVASVLANWNKNKGKATIKIGGQGSGDPYTGGMGNGSGNDLGPKDGGDPGTGGNGGTQGTDPNGKNYRHITFKPEIVNPTQEEGIVDVIIHVNREGTVTKAEIGGGGTTSNSVLQSVAAQSAYKIKLNADASAPADQAIHIDIKFTLR